VPGLLLRNRSCFRTFLGLRNVGQIIVSQTKSAADFAQKHDLLGFAKAQEYCIDVFMMCFCCILTNITYLA